MVKNLLTEIRFEQRTRTKMEDETWNFDLPTSSMSHQSVLKSLADLCVDFEEEDDELRAEYPCPYCEEDFDLVDLCCHIKEEHSFQTYSEVCPVCAKFVEVDMVRHIMAEHGGILKSLKKLKLQKGESNLILPFLKKELPDEYLESLLASKSSMTSPSNMAPDPLMSFLYNVSLDKLEKLQPGSSTEEASKEKSSDENFERNCHSSPLTDEEHMEKARRSEFVQGLLLSTIFDDSL